MPEYLQIFGIKQTRVGFLLIDIDTEEILAIGETPEKLGRAAKKVVKQRCEVELASSVPKSED